MPLLKYPTAQQLLFAEQLTPHSRLSALALAFGEETIDQLLPSQCSISVCQMLPLPWFPTAQQSDPDKQVIAFRMLPWTLLELGELAIDQEVPFQCSIRVCAGAAPGK